MENFWENEKTWIFTYFGVQSRPKIQTSEAHILHTSKSTCKEHVKQYWCETSENFLRKWPKTWILTYLGGQNWLRPIFPKPLKVLAMSMWTILMREQWKLWESYQSPEFWLTFWGPRWPKNLAFDVKAHIVHISESSSNDYIKQDLRIQRKLNKIVVNLKFHSFGGQKIWASGTYLLHTLKKWPQRAYISSFVWIQWKLFKKIDANLYTVEILYGTILYTTHVTRGTHGPQNLQRPIRTLIVLSGFLIKQILIV